MIDPTIYTELEADAELLLESVKSAMRADARAESLPEGKNRTAIEDAALVHLKGAGAACHLIFETLAKAEIV
jgi:hypothetical protein